MKTKLANELGLYDMSGNEEEWCQDYFSYYDTISLTNPTSSFSGSSRVLRGGCYYKTAFVQSPIEIFGQIFIGYNYYSYLCNRMCVTICS
ncbi:MAG: formylglycine-generating enzyme family protein [Prevotella ruminicola]|uniref:Formylglycine-generating enzyme family protein n=1 Tax=Xylanibacter ruminicola TaxID=839 RepID=A0A9D5P1N5_XYLRU|nr:formylglycine-generating enzyme family protein [Xylanibacter ruminicola]